MCFRGRVGLAGALMAAGISRGDEVITQAFTCVAVPEGIIAAQATPVFADIGEGSVNLDPQAVERLIGPRTRAIIVQHTFGYAGPINEIVEMARARDIVVIEDCCHTFSTEVEGKQVGSIGDAAFYSLEWGKPLPCGVGGAVSAQDSRLKEQLLGWQASLQAPSLMRTLRLELQYLAFSVLYRPSTYWPVKAMFQALSRAGAAEGNFGEMNYEEVSEDFNLDICAPVARRFRRKLRALNKVESHSRTVMERYRGMALSAGLTRVADDAQPGAVLARYPIWSDAKAELLEAARRSNVELADWYKTPIHPLVGDQQASVNYRSGNCPRAEEACSRIVSLPTNRGVSERFLRKAAELLGDVRSALRE